VLFSNGSTDIEVYTPDGAPNEDWQPEITDYPRHVRVKQTYRLGGRLLNGLSQVVSYGDDASMATNYPLVRIRNLHSDMVSYCRTFDHSSMGVATGLSIQGTSFKVPWGVEYGPAELCVVANGIASECVPIIVEPYQFHFRFDDQLVNHLIGSLADGPLWVLGPNGPVPVDPWGPEIRERAQGAYDDIIQGIRLLQSLGREVAKQQNSVAQSERVPSPPSGERRRQ